MTLHHSVLFWVAGPAKLDPNTHRKFGRTARESHSALTAWRDELPRVRWKAPRKSRGRTNSSDPHFPNFRFQKMRHGSPSFHQPLIARSHDRLKNFEKIER